MDQIAWKMERIEIWQTCLENAPKRSESGPKRLENETKGLKSEPKRLENGMEVEEYLKLFLEINRHLIIFFRCTAKAKHAVKILQ